MAWSPPPPAQPPPGWWVELQYNRAVDRGFAERQAVEQAKRLRRLRRRVERIDEQLCLAASASEARQHLLREGWPSELIQRRHGDSWGARGEVEHAAPGRVLRVR
jgi:hypothetical protein